jgi:hypothetical protein
VVLAEIVEFKTDKFRHLLALARTTKGSYGCAADLVNANTATEPFMDHKCLFPAVGIRLRTL